MQLTLDSSGLSLLRQTIESYYQKNQSRQVFIFQETTDPEWGWRYLHFLVDRKYVIRYGYGEDRSITGGIELAIGPHYFAPAEFWSPKEANRFTLEASTEGVEQNLRLLDEFFSFSESSRAL